MTREMVNDYKVNWAEWHDIVTSSLHAFDFDATAYILGKIGYINSGFGSDDKYPVRGNELSQEVEHVCTVLLTLYELGWEDEDHTGFVIYDSYCTAYKSVMATDGLYHAYLKFQNDNDPDDHSVPTLFNDPCIEVKLALDNQNKPWFEINFNVVMQSF